MYVDSRYRTNESESNSDLKLELNQALDLPDNTICYADDSSTPHTWRTTESHNNRFYIILKRKLKMLIKQEHMIGYLMF